jgi:hypothetical protein
MNNTTYPSKYSNGKTVSAAQFITEIICENKARKDKLDLHYRFWTHPTWAQFYRNQIASANKLVKEYGAKPIIKALQDDKGKNIYSLRAPFLVPIIEKYKDLIESENTDFTLEINRDDKQSFRQPVKKRNIISKLKELDDE